MIQGSKGSMTGCIPKEEKHKSGPWGDLWENNDNYKIRFNNVGRLWLDEKRKIDKNEEFIKWMSIQLFNILGIAETGVAWDKLSPKRHLKEIVK